MLYILGDSFSFGWQFLLDGNPNRKKLIFPFHLSNKLGIECKNYSVAGGSNHRIARLVNFLNLQKDDIVVIGWSGLARFEISVPKNQITPNDAVIDYRKIENLEDKITDSKKAFQIIEKTENLYTRSVWLSMDRNSILNLNFKKYVDNFINNPPDPEYLEQNYKTLFYSSVYRLRSVGCKFVMFTAFNNQIRNKDFLNIPEFLFWNSNVIDELRYKDKKYKHVDLNDYNYWTSEEHVQIADILYDYIIK